LKILVAWDDLEQIDLMSLYLTNDDNYLLTTTDPEEAFNAFSTEGGWEVMVLSVRLPDIDASHNLFRRCRTLRPEVPIICGCNPDDIYRLARFMVGGMKSYILRDKNGDFLFLLAAMLESVTEWVRAEREQTIAGKLREEVESVRKLQETMIPKDVNPPQGYRVVACYEPSQVRVIGGQPVTMAGGDYYDLFTLAKDRFVVLVGDASGHGMKACMSVITMHTLVRMLRDDKHLSPADFVAMVNRNLCSQTVVNSDGGFITLVYGILLADTNEFYWCSAGHPPPIIQNMITGQIHAVADEDIGGVPLGIDDTAEYMEHKFVIPPQSRLLIYTDGLIEAFPESAGRHEEFGVKGVLETMKNSLDKPIDLALRALFDDSNTFTRGSGRHDDTSAILIERFE
jgi:serine phosphatase RsbU (regulator of sigma subunit)